MTFSRRFVLLDRDGTINIERNYLSEPDQLALYPGVGAALRRLNDLGLGLLVVTNQSGVARGYFDLAQMERVHQRLREMLAAEGVALAGIYACPHGPEQGCECRKPKPGMAVQAARELGFVASEAFVVGDKMADIDFAHAFGAPGILVRTGHGAEQTKVEAADAVVADLPEAALWIERALNGQEKAIRS